MKREDQELLERAEEKENNEEKPENESHKQDDFFEDEFDREFWVKVRLRQSEGLSWSSAMNEVRVQRLIQKYKDNGELDSEDPALVMLKTWPTSKRYKGNPDKLLGLEQLISKFLVILLESELNSGNRYETFRDVDDKTGKTLLHYAAQLGFLHVTKTLVKKCPGLLALKTKAQLKPEKKRAMLPIELALIAENDEVAAYMIRMMWHERVQSLFSWRPGDMTNPQPSFFSFKSIVKNPKMKKTVMAVLDQMVNPHWPHLPKRKDEYDNDDEEEGIEGAWTTILDDPLDYHFYYHILDGDEGGRPPKIVSSEGHKQTDNEYFNLRDKSCLHLIAKSNNKEALQHPVVRMLIKTKWNRFGHWFLSLHAALYVIFLLFLSYSLIYGSTKLDPTQYRGAADSLRGICEVVTLFMVVFYICEEINQMRKTTGLYTKTLAKIIQRDVTRFMAVFVVVFLSFCGALFLSVQSSKQNQQFSGFEDVLLSGFRALSEQQPIAEDYSTFNWLSILLMLSYMGTVIVILLNILIAQMSTTYTQAKKVARLEYDVDRISLLTRMERFPFLNLRVKYYKEGDWISEMKLAKELLEFTEDRHHWESVEEKLDAIRDMMRKMVKQMRPDREQRAVSRDISE